MLKKDLRRQLLAQYRSVAPCDLSDAVRRLPAYQQARSVALYYAAGFEVSVSDLLGDTDKILLLPRCHESGMVFCRYNGMLTSDRFGIPAPTERWQGDIDLMLVPALAYDRQGGRLGRGGGFYDRALADYAGTSIGVIREAFLLDRVPMERHDKKVGSVLTEKGVYTFL